jgi:hypothetical protein
MGYFRATEAAKLTVISQKNGRNMTKETISRLQFLIDTIPSLLTEIDEVEFSEKPNLEKWSKKEIIGHLIDSATNNHQRFVRCQFENIPKIVYDQNNWNKFNYYQQINKKQIIEFWTIYNKQLVELIKNIPNQNLFKECKTSDEKNYTIGFLISDYVEHLEHHLQQIVSYKN